MKIDTTCVLSHINELRDDIRDIGCSPFHFQPLPDEEKNSSVGVSSTSLSEDLEYGGHGGGHGMVEDSGLSALELPKGSGGMTSSSSAKSPLTATDILKSILSTSSAAITSPSSTFQELKKMAISPTKASLSAKAATSMDFGSLDVNSLLSRSKARRMKLQESYKDIIMCGTSPRNSSSGGGGQNEEYTVYQLPSSPRMREGRDDDDEVDNYCERRRRSCTIRSPRVRRLYDFDIREDDDDDDDDEEEEDDQVEDYTPSHQRFGNIISNVYQFDTNEDSGGSKWNNAELRRAHRYSLQKSVKMDIAEIEQFTRDMKARVKSYSPKAANDMKERVLLDKNDRVETKENLVLKNIMMDEFEEEERKEKMRKERQRQSGIKKLAYLPSTLYANNEDNAVRATTYLAGRWKARQCCNQGEDDITDKIPQREREVPDDKLEAWWKERQENSQKISSSTSELFDQWWANQRQNQIKSRSGQGKSTTSFLELEGEPTLEEDMKNKCTSLSFVNEPSLQSSSPTVAAVHPTEHQIPSQSHSAANNVASGALKFVLIRIDETKAQFAKALEENDVTKQGELADLLARLGEAAAAMRKLEEF